MTSETGSNQWLDMFYGGKLSKFCELQVGALKVILSVCCVGESHNPTPQYVALT